MHIKNKEASNSCNNIKDLANLFYDLEDRYRLIDLEIDNVKVWQCIRYKLFISIATKLFDLGAGHQTKRGFFRQIIPMLWNSIRHSALLERPYDIIIFPHTRLRFVDGEYIDINTHSLKQEFIANDKDFLVLERPNPYGKNHSGKTNKHTKYIDDSIIFINLFKRMIRPKMKPSKKILNQLNAEMIDAFNVDIDIQALCKDAIQKFKASYKFYFFLLKKIRPKQIYLVISYEYPSLVKAAKDLDIEVIEMQHGAFSKYHLGYSYNSLRDIDYFPDKFLAWNEFWRDIDALPIPKNDIEIYPFEYQNKKVEKYKSIPKIKNQVIVISQGTITDQLSKIILDNFNFFEDKNIKYKLHPGEFESYKESYFLDKLLKKENVELVTNDNLYDLFASSEYQVGAYSTAIYEGIEFGLKTILCSTLFSEYMEELIESGKVFMVLDER